MIYLDYNATTSIHPDVRAAINTYLEEFGNPSSSHVKGVAAKVAVQEAREAVAAAIGAAAPDEIVFTGSATESNNLAILGVCRAAAPERRRLVISAVEHPAVTEPARELERQGWQLSVAPVDREGRVDLAALESLLEGAPVALVSVMLANNELGTIQPVGEIAALARKHGALMHVDAAQAIGKMAVDVEQLGANLLTIAGHKMYAPKGVGALYVRRGTPLQPIIFGASQEKGLRPGTENVPYIAGLGVAARLVSKSQEAWHRMADLRDRLQAQLLRKIPGLTVNGSQRHRLPNTLHMSLPSGIARGVIALLIDEVAMSAGAACHSDHDERPSGVMQAIGASAQQARGAVRLSLGYDTTLEDIDQAVTMIAWAYERHVGEIQSGRT